MAYPEFDLSRIASRSPEEIRPLLTVDGLSPLASAAAEPVPAEIAALGAELVKARDRGGATLFLCDAAVVRAGMARHLTDLMGRGLLTHLAVDRTAAVDDWELALTGRITGAPPPEVHDRLHGCLAAGDAEGLGGGESLGRELFHAPAPHSETSLLAQGYRWGVPVTMHEAAGGDVTQAAGPFDPAVFGRTAFRDFLVLAHAVENLEQGLVVQCGMPQAAVSCFFTALELARRAAAPYGRTVADLTATLLVPPGAAPSAVTAAAADGRQIVVSHQFGPALAGLRLSALQSAGWKTFGAHSE